MKIADGEIIAGKSISGICLGWTFEQLEEYIGKDYEVENRGSTCNVIKVENARFWINDNNVIYQILVFGDFKGKFSNCIGLGNTLKDVEDYVGKWNEEDDICVVYVLPEHEGICFELQDESEDEEWDELKQPIEYISVYSEDEIKNKFSENIIMNNSIENKIMKIGSRELEAIKNEISVNGKIYLVELDGNKIDSYNDYIKEIQEKFKFPSSCIDNINGYLDWITDLSWLEKEGFVIIIYDFNKFCSSNPEERDEILEDIDEAVLSFWQYEVKEVVAGGEPKLFMVYLVE